MNKLKLIIASILVLLVIATGAVIKVQHNKINDLSARVVVLNNNFKSLEIENNSLKQENLTYKFNLDQLEYSNDSLVVEMNKVRRQLKVKDKQLKELSYIASKASKTDTIFLKGEELKVIEPIDTTIQDAWYKLHLIIDTNKVVATPEYKSEKYITTYMKKEVDNPSRCKLLNIFKKRSNVLEVTVYEKSPYITNTKEKFIEIIK